MAEAGHRWSFDVAHRAAGAVLIGIASACAVRLYGSVHTAPPHDGSAIELLLAALAFLAASSGSLLLFLGTHIYDKVEVAERWRVAHVPNATIDDPSQPDFSTATMIVLAPRPAIGIGIGGGIEGAVRGENRRRA